MSTAASLLPRLFTVAAVLALVPGPLAAANADADADAGTPPTMEVAAPVSLNRAVEVDDVYVRLGDLFTNAGDHADRPVAHAPEPGKRTTLDAKWLYKVARGYALDWQPVSMQARTVVERASQVVGAGPVIAAVREALTAEALPASAEITLHQSNVTLHLPASAEPDVGVAELRYDATTRRFTAVIEAPAGAPDAIRRRVSGRVFTTTEVPVLAGNVAKGEVIRESDIRWVEVREEELRRDTVTDASAASGRAAKRYLRGGAPLRATHLEAPKLVTKNGRVTMAFRRPGMALTVVGRALESGAEGDVVRVENVTSETVVYATVVGPDRVSVTLDQSAMAE